MAQTELAVWITPQFPRTWTHVVKGNFADPQLDTRGATDLFCYDRSTGIGAFFATVKNGRLDDGTLVQDGPRKVGPNHALSTRWTHIVNSGQLLLFYDAAGGVGEFYATDGRGNLILKKRHGNMGRSWTLIVPGRFGRTIVSGPFPPTITRPRAHLLFYRASDGTGEFYSVDSSGNIHLERRVTGWLKTWHAIIAGNFSSGNSDDLLFYDKSRGVGVFYKVNDDIGRTLMSEHVTWRTTWKHIVPGEFRQNAPFDGLLFYEENSGHTEFYAANGRGGIELLDVRLGNSWSLPWQVILTGEFTPNIGLTGTTRFCNYDSRDGALRYFFFKPA